MRLLRKWMRVPVLLGLLLGLLGGAGAVSGAPPLQEPGPAVDRLFFKAFDVDRAPLDIRQGEMDLYLFGLKVAAATELRGEEDVTIYEAPATTLSIILNPGPAPEGQLNPFSIPEVRRAVQLLVNREFVAGCIYRGMAHPMVTHVSPLDYDQLTIYNLVREANIRYDPELGRQQIREAMEAAGAQMVDGMWQYQGNPIILKSVIRVEDERREVGDLLRTELEQAGFQVAPSYQPFAPAIQRVYSSDPVAFQWHLYTEGWGRSAPNRYDFSAVNQFAAPWMGNMPGWRAAGFWQYENDALDELGKRIFTGKFSTLEERNTLYQQATQMALDDSVRIWVATVTNSFPASNRLEGVTQDLVAGPRSPWTLREATVPGSNELTVGHLWVWTERTTWNPVGGFGDVYSVDIWRNLSDPPLWNHPFTGIPIPFRATYEVETAGPTGTLDVHPDTVVLDPQSDTWTRVGSGVKATSKVVFDYSKYFQSKWHHGQPITMADVIYSIYQGFDIAYDDEKSRIEFAMAVTARPFLETYKGFRVLDENRLEVYVDFWHFEENNIASYASPAGLSMPWEVLWAMDTLVFDKRQAAFSDTAAARFQVPWISLVMSRDARLVRNTLRQLAAGNELPESVLTVGGQTLASPEEAQARYQAVLDWFAEHELLVIGNGPFMLTRYDPPAQFAELQAYRDPSYPFSAGDWRFGEPEVVQFREVNAQNLHIGGAYTLDLELTGPGVLGLRYLLFDPVEGSIIASGEASGAGGGQFTLNLGEGVTSGLQAGLYHLYLAGYSDAVSRTTERRLDLEASTTAPTPSTPTQTATTSTPQTQPTPTDSDSADEPGDDGEEGGGGCGRGEMAEMSYALVGLALAGLVLRRRFGLA